MEFREIYKTYWQRSYVEGMSMTTIGQKNRSGYLYNGMEETRYF
jgi:hypothetical protein